jgi:acetolactate synthase-1/2/3 large subunit
MHQEREYPARVSGSDLFNPDFAALARAYGWHGEFAATTADAVAGIDRCIAAIEAQGRPALLHLELPTDVITSRTTLTAVRAAALKGAA